MSLLFLGRLGKYRTILMSSSWVPISTPKCSGTFPARFWFFAAAMHCRWQRPKVSEEVAEKLVTYRSSVPTRRQGQVLIDINIVWYHFSSTKIKMIVTFKKDSHKCHIVIPIIIMLSDHFRWWYAQTDAGHHWRVTKCQDTKSIIREKGMHDAADQAGAWRSRSGHQGEIQVRIYDRFGLTMILDLSIISSSGMSWGCC